MKFFLARFTFRDKLKAEYWTKDGVSLSATNAKIYNRKYDAETDVNFDSSLEGFLPYPCFLHEES